MMKGNPAIRWLITGLAGLLLGAPGCREDQASKIPDVADLAEPVHIVRFEEALLADTLFDVAEMQQLLAQYPAFASVYFQYIIPGAADVVLDDDPELQVRRIREWISHPRTRWLYDTVRTIFPDLKPLEAELTQAFAYARHYFPDKPTPRMYSTISDFGYFPFLFAEDSLTDGIGISLEMFLGDTFPYRTYTGLNNAFSDYLIRSYNQAHITRRALEVWINDMAGAAGGDRLLDHMIHNGQILYVLEQLLPQAADSVIIDWPGEKLDWANRHERDIWYHFTTGGWLYESTRSKIQKYIGPSPGSPGMPPEAPGNTASWLGWKIVSAYMDRHPETTLPELLAMKDAQQILDQSGYRPPRE